MFTCKFPSPMWIWNVSNWISISDMGLEYCDEYIDAKNYDSGFVWITSIVDDMIMIINSSCIKTHVVVALAPI